MVVVRRQTRCLLLSLSLGAVGSAPLGRAQCAKATKLPTTMCLGTCEPPELGLPAVAYEYDWVSMDLQAETRVWP